MRRWDGDVFSLQGASLKLKRAEACIMDSTTGHKLFGTLRFCSL